MMTTTGCFAQFLSATRVLQVILLAGTVLLALEPGAPTARIKESIICCPGEQITLDGWASLDIDGEVQEWFWDINGDSEVDTVTKRGEVTFAAPLAARLFTASLLVRDNEAKVSEPHTVSIHVMDNPPRVALPADTTVKVGVRISFEPRITAYCSPIELYEWDFDDDGVFEYKSNDNGSTSRAYTKAGKYRARFKATDAMKRETGGIRTITVTAGQPR